MIFDNKQKREAKLKHIKPIDILRLATGSLSANRLRSSLTILGITIGVFSVISTMTALTAARTSIDEGLAFMGSNVFNIGRFPSVMAGGPGGFREYMHRPPITYRQALKFSKMMDERGIEVAIYDSREDCRIRYGDRRTSGNQFIYGANENYLKAFNFNILYGRNLSSDDISFSRSVVVLGYDASQALFADRNPVGEQVYINGHLYSIVGVLARKGDLFGHSTDNKTLMPMSRFMSDIFSWHRSINISVLAPSPEQIPQTEDLAIGFMRIVRGLEPEDGNDFSVDSNDSLQESFAKIANIVGAAGLLISLIALVTAGIGIMNIMLVSVTERTQEIGIRKSIGARSRDVLKQFLIEAVFLSELGAVAGILLGVLFGNVLVSFIHVKPVIPWNWAFIAVLVCSIIGIGFGMYPAWKASRLDPVDALRFE
jgi:putative ABC transport system permease protein